MLLKKMMEQQFFAYYVKDPERYGIVEFDKNRKAISLEEKPEKTKIQFCCNWIIFL